MNRYFLTVDWCNEGSRGIFCDQTGQAFSKDDEPHTEDEMWKILGPFDLVLSPKSVELSEDEVAEYQWWTPLEEYNGAYGIARKSTDDTQPNADRTADTGGS